jgi:predicted Ser/Thr protein kinase
MAESGGEPVVTPAMPPPISDREAHVELARRGAAASTSEPSDSQPPNSQDIVRIRTLFPELDIERTLGQGGMGVVYLARQKHLNRPVALKIIAPEIAGDPTFAERFSREARTTARLTHGNVAMVFDFGEVDGVYFMIMEYVEGRNLRQLITSGGLSTHSTVNTILQVCDALHYAHLAGVVHRDIKPENVIVTPAGNVKVVDFGLAKLTDPAQRELTLTATRQVMGTPRYMSPEQMDSPQSVDHRSDIYSAGVILYELLTGELPTGHVVAPSQTGNGDARLDEVVMRALAREPERRFQSIAEFRSKLEAAVSERPATTEMRWPHGDRAQIDLVAKGILLTAAIQWFVANLIFLALVIFVDWSSFFSTWSVVLLVGGVCGATTSLFGGLRMLRRDSYWMAVAGCAASIVCFPANILGLPLGIVGLSMLMRDEVRQQFANQPKTSKPHGTSVFLFASAVMNLLMVPMFIAFLVTGGGRYDGYYSPSHTIWTFVFGMSSLAGAIQMVAYGLSRTTVLRPLICLVLVAGLFVPAAGWVAAVIAFGLSIPVFWKWRVFGWLKRHWFDWTIGLVGCAVLCAAIGGAGTLFYQVLSNSIAGTYSISEQTHRGMEPRSSAFSELQFEATGAGPCRGKAMADGASFDKVVWRIYLKRNPMQSDASDGQLTVNPRGFRYLDNDGMSVKGNKLGRDEVLKWFESSGVDIQKPAIGLEAAVIAEATDAAFESVRYGQHPGIAGSINRAAFSEGYAYGQRRFQEPLGVLPGVIVFSILVALSLTVLWIRFTYRRARLRGPHGAAFADLELPKTQFQPKGKQ